MTNKLPATVHAVHNNAQPVQEPQTVTATANPSVVSYGHGANDSFVHMVSGKRLQRTVAVMHRPGTAPAPQPPAHPK